MKVLILVCLVFAAGCQGQSLQSLLLGATTAFTGAANGKGDLEALHLPEKLKTFIERKFDNMHEVFNSAVDALAQVGSTSHSEFVDLVSTVDELVHAHHATLNNLLRELVEGIEEHFGKALHHVPAHKRNAFTDLHENVGQSVAAFVQPHIDGLKRDVGALGQGVTQTAQKRQRQFQLRSKDITGRLPPPRITVAIDILHQTLSYLDDIAQHAGQVAAQSAGALATNLGQSVLNALGAAATSAP